MQYTFIFPFFLPILCFSFWKGNKVLKRPCFWGIFFFFDWWEDKKKWRKKMEGSQKVLTSLSSLQYREVYIPARNLSKPPIIISPIPSSVTSFYHPISCTSFFPLFFFSNPKPKLPTKQPATAADKVTITSFWILLCRILLDFVLLALRDTVFLCFGRVILC